LLPSSPVVRLRAFDPPLGKRHPGRDPLSAEASVLEDACFTGANGVVVT
jgi:hypothetical protein